MDPGHFNCRDYEFEPHFAPTTIASTITAPAPPYRTPFARHESFDELERRSRSPASSKPKFPLLLLPLELRQQILMYLLPRTIKHSDPNPLADHARNFSAVKKRGARGMIIPQAKDPLQKRPSNVVWQRGNVTLLRVCHQLHRECAELLYGSNTFLLFVTYSGITFRYSWLLPSGLAPNRSFPFIELLPRRYMKLIKRLVIHIDHVDSYTSMIKFNVGGKGLTHGLRKQIQRLVHALQPPERRVMQDVAISDDEQCTVEDEGRCLAKIAIRVSNGNAFLDQVKGDIVKQREGSIRVAEDIQEMLEPFGELCGVREPSITGAVTESFARSLEQKMRSMQRTDALTLKISDLDLAPSPQLCCYGNDL